MITDSLLGQQVIGWKFIEDKKTKAKKPVLDEDVLSILKMMYPSRYYNKIIKKRKLK